MQTMKGMDAVCLLCNGIGSIHGFFPFFFPIFRESRVDKRNLIKEKMTQKSGYQKGKPEQSPGVEVKMSFLILAT